MAANDLAANQSKTVFMVLNMKKQCDKMRANEGIKVGETILPVVFFRSLATKLLEILRRY